MKCPLCDTDNADTNEKCTACGKYLKPLKWYFRTSIIVIALLSIGPLALPLVWYHPRYKNSLKIIVTLVVLLLTWVCVQATMQSISALEKYYGLISDLLQ